MTQMILALCSCAADAKSGKAFALAVGMMVLFSLRRQSRASEGREKRRLSSSEEEPREDIDPEMFVSGPM